MRFGLIRATVLAGSLLAGVALPGSAVRAQEPTSSHLAAARDLFVASGAVATIDRIIPVLVSDIRRAGITRPEMAKDLEEVITIMAPELERQKQQGYAVAARSYAKYLTEAEIKDCVTFFRSPAGIKYAKVQPEVTEDLISNVTGWAQIAAEYVMTRVRAEMLKRGHQMQ